MTNLVFKVKTPAQAAIFVHELKGQFSDGYWENHTHRGRNDHWVEWCKCNVQIATTDEELGRNFYADKDNYNLSAKDLLDAVGDRMIAYARLARAGLGLEDIRVAEYAIGRVSKNEDGKYVFEVTGGPTHTGDYWDRIRADIAAIPTSVLEQAANDTDYDMKELKHDLYLMKKYMKVYSR